jgi:hypothetical protein
MLTHVTGGSKQIFVEDLTLHGFQAAGSLYSIEREAILEAHLLAGQVSASAEGERTECVG